MPPTLCPVCAAPLADGGRFCSACGAEVGASTSAPTEFSPQGAPVRRGAASGPPSDGGRFIPGQVIGGRYRILGLLGRGGMGEVYRADDLKLGLPVALKFLPRVFADDPDRLERFFGEVRSARQVTHVNVCRVHDLDEIDGQHFLSMEYVDGEDLGTLLRRIGRVPREKAVQIARQLCAGLAAAHEQGILHRDLKPANIMLDGRGRAKITDFGLAGLADEIEGREIRAGTPAYQAPEQLAGEDVSTASDIYALGLLLYELFTGRRAFEASSVEELRRLQERSAPASLSSHVAGIEDTIERVILRCLAADPARRPRSALAVSAALPGGDPVAAALAAGETPSPEMVAEAGGEGSLRPVVAFGLLATVLVVTALQGVFLSSMSVTARVGMPKSPAELGAEARELLLELGHQLDDVDRAWGLRTDSATRDWMVDRDGTSGRWDDLATLRPRPIVFWYRQSPEWMEPVDPGLTSYPGRVTEDRPASSEPGTAAVQLDVDGWLRRLLVVPEPRSAPDEAGGRGPAWDEVLARVGLDPSSVETAEPTANPPLNCHEQRAWSGSFAEQPEISMRIEACASNGRIVFVDVVGPWDEVGDEETALAGAVQRFAVIDAAGFVLFVVILAGVALLARRNLRHGRGDRRGAIRVAATVFGLSFASSFVAANHVAGFGEIRVFGGAVKFGLWVGLFVWAAYLALEPFVRRIWPESMVSWSRLIDGRIRDPLVGRDLLIGAALAQIIIAARMAGTLIPRVRGDAYMLITGGNFLSITDVRSWLSVAFGTVELALTSSFLLLTVIVLLRVVIKREWVIAFLLTAIPVTLVSFVAVPVVGWHIPLTIAMIWAPLFVTAVRFGVVALIGVGLWSNGDLFLLVVPGSWFLPYSVASLVMLVGITVAAFWTSLGKRRLFDLDLLD